MADSDAHLEHAAHAIGSSGTHTPANEAHHKYTIRPATDSDAEAIANLGAYLFDTTFGYSLPAEDLAHYLSEAYSTGAIKGELESPQHTFLVATSANAIPGTTPPIIPGTIIAFAQLTTGTNMECIKDMPGSRVELQRLYVHDQFHGSGVARALVEAVEKIARGEQGGQRHDMMFLGVWEENPRAQRFYQKMGFSIKAGSKDFRMGSVIQTDEVFVKPLEY